MNMLPQFQDNLSEVWCKTNEWTDGRMDEWENITLYVSVSEKRYRLGSYPFLLPDNDNLYPCLSQCLQSLASAFMLRSKSNAIPVPPIRGFGAGGQEPESLLAIYARIRMVSLHTAVHDPVHRASSTTSWSRWGPRLEANRKFKCQRASWSPNRPQNRRRIDVRMIGLNL